MKALLLVNRKARQGKDDLGPALDRLRAAGVELVEASARHPRELSELIRRHRRDVQAVIVGGGDGTLNAAADGLVDAGLPFGILPLGTANDLARTLGLPAELDAACDVIAAGHTRRIDVGRVNGKHFFNVASLGLSVAITKALRRETKSRWGVLAYLVTALRVLWRSRPFAVEITGGGETVRVKTVQVAVGNGRYYGGGMTVDEHARIDDGVLRLYSLEINRWWQIIPLLPALRNGTLADSAHARTLQGPEFEVRPLRRSRAVNTDGEITGRTPARFTRLPRAVEVFAPPLAPASVEASELASVAA